MKAFSYVICTCIFVVACFLPISCEKDKDEKTVGEPVLSVSVTTIATVAEGGSYYVIYGVSNPVPDGTVNVLSSDDWVCDLDTSSAGMVEFTVLANDTTLERECQLLISYVWSDGQSTASVTVVQAQMEEDEEEKHKEEVSALLGAYTATAIIVGNGFMYFETSWTMTFYEYEGSGDYDILIDGILPVVAGNYPTYGHAFSAAAVERNGKIHVPSQMTEGGVNMRQGESYGHCSYTPCVGFTSSGAFYHDDSWPDLVFTGSARTGEWESDYGEIMYGCTGDTLDTCDSYIQLAVDSITIVKD